MDKLHLTIPLLALLLLIINPEITVAVPIVNGNIVSSVDDLSFVARIVKRGAPSTSPSSTLCTGLLLSSDKVLTSAHCVVSNVTEDFTVVLNRPDMMDTTKGCEYPINKIATHYAYQPDSKTGNPYDLAMITIGAADPSSESDCIRRIFSKYIMEFVGTGPSDGQKLQIAGWGETKIRSSTLFRSESKNLRQTSLQIQSDEFCQRHAVTYTKGMFCAYGGNGGTGKGDSGAPVFMLEEPDSSNSPNGTNSEIETRTTVKIYGIASFSLPAKGIFYVLANMVSRVNYFVRITEYLEWIAIALELPTA